MNDFNNLSTRLARMEQRVMDIDERGSRGLGRVEQRVARAEQHLADVDHRVTALIPTQTAVIQLVEQMALVRRDLAEYRRGFEEALEEREERDQTTRRESRQTRALLITVSVSLVCALIGAIAVVLATVVH